MRVHVHLYVGAGVYMCMYIHMSVYVSVHIGAKTYLCKNH